MSETCYRVVILKKKEDKISKKMEPSTKKTRCELSPIETKLQELREKYTNREFRINPSGQLQKLCKKWKTLCVEHGVGFYNCKYCNPSNFCDHKKRFGRCGVCIPDYYCDKHNRIAANCVKCKGKNVCDHEKIKSYCIVCTPKAFCVHEYQKHTCKYCPKNRCDHGVLKRYCRVHGKGYCYHEIRRSRCIECDGNELCEHEMRHEQCIECGGSRVCPCGLHLKVKDGFCIKCHPNYIETGSGSSKIACEFLDRYAAENRIHVQHIHYNYDNKTIEGTEHTPSLWKQKKIDGFHICPHTGDYVALEFLGDYYHGHPFTHPDVDRFEDTQRKLTKLLSLGYKVYYIWESDFMSGRDFWAANAMLREFAGKLEWK
jgi:hypothetical protein